MGSTQLRRDFEAVKKIHQPNTDSIAHTFKSLQYCFVMHSLLIVKITATDSTDCLLW